MELEYFGAGLLLTTSACCTVPILEIACFLCTSSHCLPESTSAGVSLCLKTLVLPLRSDPDSRLRDRWRRCFLCDRPEPRDISLSLSDIFLLLDLCLLPDLESFDDWLSTELDRWRRPVDELPLREEADLTDFGLELIPNNPRCWLFIQPALLVLKGGESGTERCLYL